MINKSLKRRFVMKNIFIVLLLVVFVVGCAKDEKDADLEKESIETNGENPVIIAQNLTIPWTINKMGDTFYLSQREGSVTKINEADGSKITQSFQSNKKVLHTGEGGLLGFILTPDFETSREAIAYHTYAENNQIFNRVIVVRLEGDTWLEQNVLVERIPGGRIHNGGRLKIGPDGKLYVTTGDAGNPNNAQTLNNLAGKILRINLNGTIPEDNPFANSAIFSYGHRNPQGLAWDSEGNLYSTEHGQSAHDEINLIKRGKNYGWPIIEGDEEAPNLEKPIYHTGTETWAPSGIAIHENNLYIATLRGSKLIKVDLSDLSREIIFDQAGRLRDVLVENGELYTITNNLDGRGTPQPEDDKLIQLSISN
jgi:glucose/arabinose dehydrogenase